MLYIFQLSIALHNFKTVCYVALAALLTESKKWKRTGLEYPPVA
jgi:hypothetical protein